MNSFDTLGGLKCMGDGEHSSNAGNEMRNCYFMFGVLVTLWSWFLPPTTIASDVVDGCRVQLPHSLVAAVARSYPEYDLPLFADNQGFDIEFNRRHGGLGCLGVATADFNGDGKDDFALALKARGHANAIAVAALSTGAGWSLQKISSSTDRKRLYVAVVPPDSYDNVADATGDPTQQRKHEILECQYPGILTGSTREPGTIFCLTSTVKASRAEWRQLPGMLHCVHQVPNGASVSTENDDVVLNGVIIDHIGPCPNAGVLTSGPYPGAGGGIRPYLFDNARMTVMDVRLKQGESAPMTPWSADTVTLFLEGGRIRTVNSTGHFSIADRAFGDAILIPKGKSAVDTLQSGGPAHEVMIWLKAQPSASSNEVSDDSNGSPLAGATKILDDPRFSVWRSEGTGINLKDRRVLRNDAVVANRCGSYQSNLTSRAAGPIAPQEGPQIRYINANDPDSEAPNCQSALYLVLK